MSGKDYKFYVSSDGTSTGVKTEVEFQGDMTVNEGKPINRTAYKNGTTVRHGEEGFSGSVVIAPREPLSAGQAILMGHYDAETACHCWIETATTGGQSWEGPLKFSVGDWPLSTDGEFEVTVEFAEDGNVVRSVV